MCWAGWPEPPLSVNSPDGPWGHSVCVTGHKGQPCRQALSSGLERQWALLTLLTLAWPLPCVAGWHCSCWEHLPSQVSAPARGGSRQQAQLGPQPFPHLLVANNEPLVWVASLGPASSIRCIASEEVGDHPNPGMCRERRAVIDSWDTTLCCIIQPTFLILPLLNPWVAMLVQFHTTSSLSADLVLLQVSCLKFTLFSSKKVSWGLSISPLKSLVGFAVLRPSCKAFFQRMFR